MKSQNHYLVVFTEDPAAKIEFNPRLRRRKDLTGACFAADKGDLNALIQHLEKTGRRFLAARHTEDQERGANFETHPFVLIKFDPDIFQLTKADDPKLGCFDAVHHEAFIAVARGIYVLRNDRAARQRLDDLFIATGILKRGIMRLPFKDGIYCDEVTRKLSGMETIAPVVGFQEL